jgi:hypothetical protein
MTRVDKTLTAKKIHVAAASSAKTYSCKKLEAKKQE